MRGSVLTVFCLRLMILRVFHPSVAADRWDACLWGRRRMQCCFQENGQHLYVKFMNLQAGDIHHALTG